MSEEKEQWTDDLGNTYDTYEDYCNSLHLDLDIIFSKLWRGHRTPQNDEEKEWLKDLEEKKKRGVGLELNFN